MYITTATVVLVILNNISLCILRVFQFELASYIIESMHSFKSVN